MKRPKVHKKRISVGPAKASVVAKIRRTSVQAYGTRTAWSDIRDAVKKRDGYKCVKCNRPESEHGLQVDHIIEVSKGGHSVMHNLRSLCPYCHAARPSHRKAKHLILAGVKNGK